MASIGSTLREERIRLGLGIDQVEADTKIRAKYLMALEDERFEALPGTAYARAFLRDYAEQLGLDPQELVNRLNAVVGAGGRRRARAAPRRSRPARSSAGGSGSRSAARSRSSWPSWPSPRTPSLGGGSGAHGGWSGDRPERRDRAREVGDARPGRPPQVAKSIRFVFRAGPGNTWLEVRKGSANGQGALRARARRRQPHPLVGRKLWVTAGRPVEPVRQGERPSARRAVEGQGPSAGHRARACGPSRRVDSVPVPGDDLSALPVQGLLDELASESPAPAGGSAAAVAVAMAAALVEMGARRSPGWEDAMGVAAQARAIRRRIVPLVQADADAYAASLAALACDRGRGPRLRPRRGDRERAGRAPPTSPWRSRAPAPTPHSSPSSSPTGASRPGATTRRPPPCWPRPGRAWPPRWSPPTSSRPRATTARRAAASCARSAAMVRSRMGE